MEHLVEEMENEKLKLEEASDQLIAELKKVSSELQATSSAMKEVETEREELVKQQTQLSSLLSVSSYLLIYHRVI